MKATSHDAEAAIVSLPDSLWEKYAMAIDEISRRLDRVTQAFDAAGVPYALVGGQAVAIWVATRDPDAVRTTKDIDLLLRRDDLPLARAAASSVDLEYCEILGVGMFVERAKPHPKNAVHLVWAGEKVRPEHPLPAPSINQRQSLPPGKAVIALRELAVMKLMANRDLDRVHLRDMIDVGLIERDMLASLPAELARRLETLLTESGR